MFSVCDSYIGVWAKPTLDPITMIAHIHTIMTPGIFILWLRQKAAL